MSKNVKNFFIACLLSLVASVHNAYAQQDSLNIPRADTTKRVFSATVTITEIMDSAFQMHYDTLIVENDDPVHLNKHKFQTNWLIFDLGFANFNDKTPYGTAAANEYLQAGTGGEAFTKSDMRLRTVKSSNVNIWVFMQKYNLYKNRFNLKYGLGLEMFNFRYQNDITYHKNPDYIYRDTISFEKNKLYTSYASIPLMLNYDPMPGQKWGFSASAGILAGYRIGGHTKQKSKELGKVKQGGSFDLNDWRLAYTAELGLGPLRIYGTYSIKPLQNNVMDQHPYAIGIRFSNW
ncbi:MAG: outer membrane beta-barrel protein [Chitinophagaceae bacterium]